MTISMAQGQMLTRFVIHPQSAVFFPDDQLLVTFSRSFSFDKVSAGIIESYREGVENYFISRRALRFQTYKHISIL